MFNLILNTGEINMRNTQEEITNEFAVIIPEEIRGNIPDDLIVDQIDKAIKFLANFSGKDPADLFFEIKGIDLKTIRFNKNGYGVYAKIHLKTGEKCTIPIIYVFDNEIIPANENHMFEDGECEF